MEYKNNMMKIKPNCKKTKSCEECGKCKIKQEKNIYGGSATILIGILALILPNIIIHFR